MAGAFGTLGLCLLGMMLDAVGPKSALKEDFTHRETAVQTPGIREPGTPHANPGTEESLVRENPAPTVTAFPIPETKSERRIESAICKKDSPEAVGRYLEEQGLRTLNYTKVFDDEYAAVCDYKLIGPGVPQCNLTYFIEGTENAVKRVTLKLNVNNQAGRKHGHAELLAASLILAKKATGQACPFDARRAIEAARSGEWKRGDVTFKVIREEFAGTLKGYSLRLEIE